MTTLEFYENYLKIKNPDGSFSNPFVGDYQRWLLKKLDEFTTTYGGILKPRISPAGLSSNPYIKAHMLMADMELTERYATYVTVIRKRQCGQAKDLADYHTWLMPILAGLDFIVVGKNLLQAIPIPNSDCAEIILKEEFQGVIDGAYKKLMQYIKEAKPKNIANDKERI